MIFHVGCVVEGCVKCDSHGNLLHGVGAEGISPKKKPDLKRSGFLSVTKVRICLSLIGVWGAMEPKTNVSTN
jgi:hypothetical protein